MVEVKAEVQVRWVDGQDIREDVFNLFQIKGAEGFKKICF